MRQAIITKYLSPTNFRGARIKAIYAGGSITLGWDYNLDTDENHFNAAIVLFKKLGWNDFGKLIAGSMPNSGGYCFVQVPNKGKKGRK